MSVGSRGLTAQGSTAMLAAPRTCMGCRQSAPGQGPGVLRRAPWAAWRQKPPTEDGLRSSKRVAPAVSRSARKCTAKRRLWARRPAYVNGHNEAVSAHRAELFHQKRLNTTREAVVLAKHRYHRHCSRAANSQSLALPSALAPAPLCGEVYSLDPDALRSA